MFVFEFRARKKSQFLLSYTIAMELVINPFQCFNPTKSHTFHLYKFIRCPLQYGQDENWAA